MSKKTLLYVILALFCCSTLIVIGSTNNGTKYHSQDIEKLAQTIQKIEKRISEGEATPKDLERLQVFREMLAEKTKFEVRQEREVSDATDSNGKDFAEEARSEEEAILENAPDYVDPAKLAADAEITARKADSKRSVRANTSVLTGTAVDRSVEKEKGMLKAPESADYKYYKDLLKKISDAKAAGDVATAERLGEELETIELPQASRENRIGSLDQGGDDCASATVISSLPYCDEGTTEGYTNDYDTPAECTSSTSAPDVVYSYTPTADQNVLISTGGSDFDTQLYIVTDCSDIEANYIACDDDDGPSNTSCIPTVALTNGVTYYIIVDGYSTYSGAYVLKMDVVGGIYDCEDAWTCAGPPTGRCCYGELYVNPTCEDDVTEEYCDGVSGEWLEGETCASAPCFVCTPHHTLTDADQVIDADGTCGDGDNIDDTDCLGSYDNGEENIIEWTVTTAGTYRIILDTPTTYSGMALATDCIASTCIDYETNSSSGGVTISCQNIDPGTYYLFVDTYPSPDCLTEYTVTTEICPIGRCCYGTPEALQCQDLIEDDCLALADDLGWDVTLTCTTDPCDDLGRCCYGSPSDPDCADENEFACLARENDLSWDGDLDCTTDCPVVLGRCCYGDETEPGFTEYDCAHETEVECLAREDYVSWDEGIDCQTSCPPPPTGRCCYGDEWTVSCTDEYQALCELRDDFISWDDAMDCTTNPCDPPVCDYTPEPVAATCTEAILLTPPVARVGDITGGDFLDENLLSCGTSASGHVVWYRVLGTGNTMTVNFCDDCNINFDSIIRVYACACDLEKIHCVGGADFFECDPETEASHPGGYTWCTNLDEEYYIVAGAYYEDDVEGEFILHLTDDGTPCAEPVGCPTGRCCYGDPGDPTCAAGETEYDCEDLGAGGYYEWTEGADCSEPCPVIDGRCCYGDPQAPSCEDETEYECLARMDAITWDEGETCAYTPVTYNVTVYDDYYDPADIVINQGDMVTWTWDANVVNAHNVNSDDGTTFNSGTPVATPGFTFSHVFSDPVATYGYHCDNHPTMIGSVQVLAAPVNSCAVILGRCCYGDPTDQSCAYETEIECLNRADGLTWDEGIDCSEDCVNFLLGQNCYAPIEVTLDNVTPYDAIVNTCGMVDDCSPNGEDMTFKLTVTVAGSYDFNTCNPGTEANTEFDTYLKLFDECCGSTSIVTNDTYSDCATNSDLARIECYYLEVGEYWLSLEVWECCSTPLCGDVQLTITPCIGRCCYDDIFDPTCTDGIGPDACEALGDASAGGYWNWDIGLDCSGAPPCPLPEPGDLCENQVTVSTLPFDFTWDMCLYDGNCSYYDLDTFFEIVIDHDGRYTISLCNPGSTAPGSAYMSLRSDGCCGSTYLYPSTTYCGDYREYRCYEMTAGTYYLVVYQYTADCGQLQLTVDECMDWRCCYGDPFNYACMDTTEAACADTIGVWTEFVTCSSDPCVSCTAPAANDACADIVGTCPVLVSGTPVLRTGDNTCSNWSDDCVNDPADPADTSRAVWECFELTECSDVTISYCGSEAFGQGYVFVVLTTDCICSNVYYDLDSDWTTCGDGNPTLHFYNMPPGIYYHPIHRDRGPAYQVEFLATTAPTGRCCYGDPLDLTCTNNMNKCDCDDLNGAWLEGGDCTTNPCPEPCPLLLSESTYFTTGSYPISEVQPTDVVVNVPDDFEIIGIRVGIDLVHTYDGDIGLTLESPLGTFIELTSDNGGSGANYECTIFDMSATTAITAGSAPFNGEYIPEGDLDVLIGTSSLGNWTFHFTDNGSGDEGTIFSVAVELISAECDPIEDLAIYYDMVNAEFDLSWNNPQEAEYKVWSTSNPNNDGDPDDGADPDWELEADLGTLPAGPAATSILWADLPTDYANIVVTAGGCGPVFLGRCCYNTTECVETTEDDCLNNYSGAWEFGLDCTTLPPCGEYCEPCWDQDGPDYDDWIENVTFNTISYNSDTAGLGCQYDDQTALSTTVTQGVMYTLSVTIGVDGAWDQTCTVWFDWNHDGYFNSTAEQYHLGCLEFDAAGSDVLTTDITIPATATVGTTRMRVTEKYTSGCAVYPLSCEEAMYGETEDFTITIVAP
jgi:plastocyanin/subtilisin-like proprotein convertase family protein